MTSHFTLARLSVLLLSFDLVANCLRCSPSEGHVIVAKPMHRTGCRAQLRGDAHVWAKARRPPVPVAAAALVECWRTAWRKVADCARSCARICCSPARSPANDDDDILACRQLESNHIPTCQVSWCFPTSFPLICDESTPRRTPGTKE